MPTPSAEDRSEDQRDELRAHLVASRIAGAVATSRASNIGNIRKMLAREPLYTFGLELEKPWTYDGVVALMAERCGIDPDGSREYGADTIGPDRTLERLDAMAERLAKAAADSSHVLLATGHPTGLLAVHLRVAEALAAAGCTVLTPGEGTSLEVEGRSAEVRYLNGVAMIRGGADFRHTHDPAPMRAILDQLEEPPDLVVADHGWAGGAAERGIDTVGFADCNDPALFVGEAEGKVAVCVPLDDNVAPHLYDPVTAYLLRVL